MYSAVVVLANGKTRPMHRWHLNRKQTVERADVSFVNMTLARYHFFFLKIPNQDTLSVKIYNLCFYAWVADVNECAPFSPLNTCIELEHCVDLPGSFYCKCLPGYFRNSATQKCQGQCLCLCLFSSIH